MYHEAFIPLPLRHRSFFSRSFLLSLSLSLSLPPAAFQLCFFPSLDRRRAWCWCPLLPLTLAALSLFLLGKGACCCVRCVCPRNQKPVFLRHFRSISHTRTPLKGLSATPESNKAQRDQLDQRKQNKHLPETVEYLASKILLRVCLCESLGRTASRRLFQPVCPPVRIYIRRHRRHV